MNWFGSWESFIRVVEMGSMVVVVWCLDCMWVQVSKQIVDLEWVFGVQFIECLICKFVLMFFGEVFYQYVLCMLEIIWSIEIVVKNFGDKFCGVLWISVLIIFGWMYIVLLLLCVVVKYFDFSCELVLIDQLVDLFDDNIDLVLCMIKVLFEDVVVKKLVLLKWMICGLLVYFVVYGELKMLQELVGYSCFSFFVNDVVWEWVFIDGQGNEIKVLVGSWMQFNNIDCVFDVVLCGDGLVILLVYFCCLELVCGCL